MSRESRERGIAKRAERLGRPPSVMEVAFARVGMRKGQRVFAFVAAWALAERDCGESMTIDDYAEWWKMDRSTAFREQAAFRECFPEWSSPRELVSLCRARRQEPSLALLARIEFA